MDTPLPFNNVVVHPIVLLSVVDHYSREAKDTNKRVVGTLLGEFSGSTLHITNSFAVPFEEDSRDPTVWYFDHNYHEKHFHMFKKINAKEAIVGWYSTGPKIKTADLEIHEVYRRYCPASVYVIINPNVEALIVPTVAYTSIPEPTSDKTFRRVFKHIPSTIGAHEAEEVGVEHLLRDLKNASTSTLATQVGDKLHSLKILISKLEDMSEYLSSYLSEKLTFNAEIMYNLQEIFNLLPDMDDENLVKAFAVETNDMMLALYLGSVVRAAMALHNLINNKIDNKRLMTTKQKPSVALPSTEATKSST
ncbi:Mov34/MPN/PAD-1 family protein [Cardiosporidium cionae]|uniref:Mov34/MPN/PAD-1 family protein n=1 Tax=Cardiosporidium cionae TaxID=476202 RepID=A0ABQ7JEI8_9APIC|nr:Mov34/MPN/PAD-1 family protein [Cardiosporidium cionae]|eukprot:KAF8822386.1 Mov34/MPN/PAD-1 family protein [Cardiosporidium cionae]